LRLVRAAEMREMDLDATRCYGIPGLILMENAGLSIVKVIMHRFFKGKPQGKKAVIFAGPGNNGGDGFVVARHLVNKGALVEIFITTAPENYKGDAAVNLEIVNNMGISCQVLQPDALSALKPIIKEADLVVDALFGTGFKGVPREPLATLIGIVNDAGSPVLAVDIPSGLEADTGRVNGECIRAAVTVTMGMPKIGLYLNPGSDYTGEVVVGDISFPPQLKGEAGGGFYLLDQRMVAGALPSRLPIQHKGDFGHVVVIGGTRGYTGAAALASNAALRGGREAAEAIMTTDTVTKEFAVKFSLSGKEVVIGGIAKGSGMIHPNMATMLAFITTDADVEQQALDHGLRWAVERSFNSITVDGDTSTNDMVVIMANGQSGNPCLSEEDEEFTLFREALLAVCTALAKTIARDGEGATKFMEVQIKGAANEGDARRMARAVAGSNLVKTAVCGEDPNWGRILSAAGASGVPFDPNTADVYLGDLQVAAHGQGIPFDEEQAGSILQEHDVLITVDLHQGKAVGKAWGCDLSYDYVRINADYRT
jgi:glutamate N-acetyltransferase/amino-acid N-acetyltransferase